MVAIDTLAYARKLKAAGVPDAVAEAQAEALNEAIEAGLVTKADLDRAVEELRGEIAEQGRKTDLLRVEMKRDITRAMLAIVLGNTAIVGLIAGLFRLFG
jgi:hypothetical protein